MEDYCIEVLNKLILMLLAFGIGVYIGTKIKQ
jgi:hypothetical protein